MNKCNKCSVKFKNGAKKVGCSFCGKWYHASEECAGMKNELWEVICKEKQLHWYCQDCNKVAPDVIAIVQQSVKENVKMRKEIEDMKKEIEDMKQEISDLKDEVTEIKEGEDETLKETMKKIAQEVYLESQTAVEPQWPTNPESVRTIAKEEVHENNDKKGREANIVISNVDEELDAESEVTEILAHLNVSVEVEGIRRMGRERIENKNRLIWVKLGNKKERNSVLDKAKNLKANARWKQIYINKDMTEQERKEAYELRIELRERRRNEVVGLRGKSKFVIHRGRVIHKEENAREPTTPADGIQDAVAPEEEAE